MMLKDKLDKFFNNSKKVKDPLKLNIMDGFVDIKGYKVKKDGSKQMVYHDCGDNVVTDWMRQIIMLALTGTIFSKHGKEYSTSLSETVDNSALTSPSYTTEVHNSSTNLDGYLINGNKDGFFWGVNEGSDELKKYSQSIFINNKFSLFPTKVLFGTGKEYSSWELLQAENEDSNNVWYNKMLNLFGNGNVGDARNNFNKEIDNVANKLSGTIASGITAGDGKIVQTRTVNTNNSLDANMGISTNRSVGISGAIKTLLNNKSDSSKIDPSSGKMKPTFDGVGRPSFIYFRTPIKDNNIDEAWNDSSSDIFLSKDSDNKFINKITFKINMPAQNGIEYYPYNGYTLRQIGLYNDALLKNNPDDINKKINDDPYLPTNMPCGTLLAIKNIPPIEKDKDLELVMTWTLTI